MGLHIELYNSNGTYSSGQIVEGWIVIETQKLRSVNEITISLEGGCRVHWREQFRDTRNDIKTIDCSAEENYLSYQRSLLGDGENPVQMSEETTGYPFRFFLPFDLPSSFTSSVGNVSYFLVAEVQRPFLYSNEQASLGLTVNGASDLNLDNQNTLPQEIFVSGRGQIRCVLSLPKRPSFVPGELLDFEAEITNNDGTTQVRRVKASLHQIITFHAQLLSKIVKKKVFEVKGPKLGRGESETWIPDNFIIPQVPPTNLGGNCRLIDIQYFLVLEMISSGFSDSLTVKLPIIIGTAPLRNSVEFCSSPTSTIPISSFPPLQDTSLHNPFRKNELGTVFVTHASATSPWLVDGGNPENKFKRLPEKFKDSTQLSLHWRICCCCLFIAIGSSIIFITKIVVAGPQRKQPYT